MKKRLKPALALLLAAQLLFAPLAQPVGAYAAESAQTEETGAESTETESTGAESTEAESTETESTEAESTGTEAEAESIETESTGTEAEAESTETESTGTEAEAESTETESTGTEAEAESTETESTGTEAEAESTETEAKETEAEADADGEILKEESQPEKEDAGIAGSEENVEAAAADAAEEASAQTAEEEEEEEEEELFIWINPIYEYCVDSDDFAEKCKEKAEEDLSGSLLLFSAYGDAQSEYTVDEAAGIVKDALKERQESVTCLVKKTNNKLSSDIYYEIFDKAMDFGNEDDCDILEGDYLRYNVIGYGGDVEYSNPYYTFTYTFTYTEGSDMSAAEMEEAVAEALPDIYAGLELSSQMTEYEKIAVIYKYLCENVVYDNDYYSKDSAGDYSSHSAYAAIVEGCAVCQGYSLAMYRMCRDWDIDIRCIAGYAEASSQTSTAYNYSTRFAGDHAWNMAKCDGAWYNLDATWDANYGQYGFELTSYPYFLKNKAAFTSNGTYHKPALYYESAAFTNTHTMASSNYPVYDISTGIGELYACQMLLGDRMALRMYFSLPEETTADADAYIVVSAGEDKEAAGYYISSLQQTEVYGETLHYIDYYLSPKTFTDTIYVQVVTSCANSNIMGAVPAYYAASLANYGDESYSAVAASLLWLGTAAQKYFGYNEDDLADSYLNSDFDRCSIEDALAATAGYSLQSGTGTARCAGLGLNLWDDVNLAFYFHSGSFGDITVKGPEEDFVDLSGTKISGSLATAYLRVAGGHYSEDISCSLLDSNGNELGSATSSIYAYIHSVLADESGAFSDELKELCRALYDYDRCCSAMTEAD